VTFDAFAKAVDKLVARWRPESKIHAQIPRDALRAIWEQVRDDTAHDLAKRQERHDREEPDPYAKG